jgi:hypothetical protein
MFSRRNVARSRREYDLQPAPEFLFERRPFELRCTDRIPGRRDIDARTTYVVLAGGHQPPYLLTRLDELHLSRADVPALTVAADPSNSVAVAGSVRPDWSLRFCAEGEGDAESKARECLHRISMTRVGGTVSLKGPHLLTGEARRGGRGFLVVDAPADAPIVIHASYAAVQVRDLTGPVRLSATHGRATILNTTGQVDGVALIVDFAGSRGRATLSAESEMNLNISVSRFEGTVLAWAHRAVKVLVPPGFATPFRALVSRRENFVCRTDFSSRMTHEKKGDLHYFTYAGDNSAAPETVMHLRSEEATVVIDTMKAPGSSDPA